MKGDTFDGRGVARPRWDDKKAAMPAYVMNALGNAAAAIGVAVLGWLFVAWQRASRLREQLSDLAAIVRGDREGEIEQLYKPYSERQAEWESGLKAIQIDLDRIPDRLIRLNSATQRELANVFHGLEQNLGKELTKILAGESGGNPVVDRAVQNLEKVRASVGIRSFLEVPRKQRGPSTEHNHEGGDRV